jgi:hypothetical protein
MMMRFLGFLIGAALRVVMTLGLLVLFLVVFVPSGLLLRIVGADPLSRRWDPRASSYWRSRSTQSKG